MVTRYKLVFSKIASQDLDDTFNYISCCLNAPKAAASLMSQIHRQIKLLTVTPYMCPACSDPIFSRFGYRKLVIQNYLVIYYVDEKSKSVYIVRVSYGKSNYASFIE